jgi:hypothetical protein
MCRRRFRCPNIGNDGFHLEAQLSVFLHGSQAEESGQSNLSGDERGYVVRNIPVYGECVVSTKNRSTDVTPDAT